MKWVGRKEENLGSWTIKRTVDGQEKAQLELDPDFVMKPMARIKIWAKGTKPGNAPDTDFECEEESWGVGSDIITKLYNTAGEDKASHIQKTVYL